MTLPTTDREIYNRNPLAEVTAQLQFPPILRIEAEVPSQFQEAIRDRYPLYKKINSAAQLPAEIPAPVRNLIQGMGGAAGPTLHIFESTDQKLAVCLSHQTLALKTTAYVQWEAFRDLLEFVRDRFQTVYQPPSYTRIGLRYVDIIRRSILGLENVRWSELINPGVGAALTADEFAEGIDSASSQTHCQLDGEDNFLLLRTGIAHAGPRQPGGSPEKCFVIDSDFHSHKVTELGHVTNRLDTFNRFSGNLFRWAIRPPLRGALQPQLLAG